WSVIFSDMLDNSRKAMSKYKSYFALPFFQEGAKKMILITGGYGQLGTELRHLLDEQGIEYV
ncbi:hypothetical protein, partial [Enterococcus faecalis]|uniref:hypothetical protein n=1 Tax=Enterococcus faecalis TaxID=1351 RepID=UPI00311C90C1